MKIIYIEANAEELKSNRTLMDAMKDIADSIVNTFNAPISDELEDAINQGKFEDFEDIKESEEE